MKAITDLFWAQIGWLRPESHLAKGDRCLVFVSSDHELFVRVQEALRSRSRHAD